MLERVAVRRLESGGLRLLQSGRSRKRILHPVFWIHGAGGLDFAAAAASLFGGGCGTEDGVLPETTITTQKRAEPIQLDFLYPSGALAFLRHLSRTVPQREVGAFSAEGSKREFSTQLIPPETQNTQAVVSSQIKIHERSGEESSNIGPVVLPPIQPYEGSDEDDFTSLTRLFRSGRTGCYESAWYHYCREYKGLMSKSDEIKRNNVIKYLIRSSNKLEWVRTLSIINTKDLQSWSAEDYRNAVRCWMRLGDKNRTLDILKSNTTNCMASRNSGFEDFMRYCVMTRDWDMALKVYGVLRDRNPGDKRMKTQGAGKFRMGTSSDRRLHLDTTTMAKEGSNELSLAYVTIVLDWAATTLERGPKTAPSLLEEMVEDLVKGCFSYITRPHAPWVDNVLEDTWDFMKKRKGWVITRVTWERLFTHLAGHRQDSQVVAFYEDYRERQPSRMPLKIMNRILRCFSRLDDLEGMQVVFDDIYSFSDMKQPDRESFSILMAAVARRGDPEAIRNLMQYYVQKFSITTSQELSHGMQAEVKLGNLQEVVAWFNKIEEHGLKHDVIAYNILINAYSRAGDADGAARRVQEMLDKELEPDSTTFNILLNMCARRGDIAGAGNIFNLIKQGNHNPSSYTYQSMVAAHVAVQEMDKADNILESVADMSFDTSPTPIWNTVISGYAALGDSERVNQIFEMMYKRNVPFDHHTYGIVMHSLCVAGKIEAAEETLVYMQKCNFHINSDKYAILMVGYTRIGNYPKVWETFRRMLNNGIKADFNTLAILVKSYAHAEVKDYEGLEGDVVNLIATEQLLNEAMNEVEDVNLSSFDVVKSATPPWLFTPLINVYFKKSAWGRATQIFNRFLEASSKEKYGARPNLEMYKSMMQVYHQGREVEGVRNMWEGLKETAQRLHKSMSLVQSRQSTILESYKGDICGALSIFIRAMAQAGELKSIERDIDEVQNLGYTLDNVNWNDYVQALTLLGDLSKAAKVCECNLMSRWKDIRLYFLYSDSSMRGEKNMVLPAIRPFVRTIEGIATELRILDNARKHGDLAANAALVEIFRDAPTTWEACDVLEDMDGRASREMMFRLQKSRQVERLRGDGDR